MKKRLPASAPDQAPNPDTVDAKASHHAPKKRRRIIAAVFLVSHILGVIASFDALMSTRTAQGAIAWIISLNTWPIIAVPAYCLFGRSRFQGYVLLRQDLESHFDEKIEEIRTSVRPFVVDSLEAGSGALAGATLAEMPVLTGNRVELLIDGQATFDSILAGIDEAKDYVLVQFYIVRDDELGNQLKDHLIAKAKQGVRVWFLYDEIGTRGLEDYWKDLTDAGVKVTSFHSTRGPRNRFQLNFRNHRKIVVVDGKTGWVGGHNVGDEYMGRSEEFGNWRDTHVKITGPAVLELQLSFIEDWCWATDEIPSLSWQPVAAEEGDATVLILPTGPADRLESCSLMYQQAIHSAKQRIWIASPYFVPDDGIISALHLATLRGVDVKIIIPDVADSPLVYYSAYTFVGELLKSGIEIYRYEPGFLHEKVFLVDDRVAGVGTANFDNRSFRLNFEVTALIHDEQFAQDMAAMFEDDFAHCRLMTAEEVEHKPLWFRALARLSYLTAPVQ